MTRNERLIIKLYNTIYKQVFNAGNTNALSRNDRNRLIRAIGQIQNSKKYDEFAKKFAKILAKNGLSHQRGVWRKYFNAAKSTGHIGLTKTWQQYEFDVMTKAIEHNFKMIKSIPDQMKEILNHKYTSVLIEEVAKGSLPRGSFAKTLASHGHKQAKLIARTETAKLQTAILQSRALDLGSVAYIWLSSKDKRTRPSHQAMNGVVVFWREGHDLEKPLLDNMFGHAGEYPNCRCSPQPIVDVEDLTENWYRVYDYRTKQIVKLSKKQLISAIEQGNL